MNPPEHDVGFDEPWQAYAFVLARELAAAGVFSRAEWSATLGTKLREQPGVGNDAYYRAVLAALELLIIEKSVASTIDLSEMKECWRQAYISTPHGKPVVLANAPVGT